MYTNKVLKNKQVSTTLSGWELLLNLEDYFAGIVSISFSAFDPFLPQRSKMKHQINTPMLV